MRDGFVLVGTNRLVGMRCQRIMKKVFRREADGKDHQQQQGNKFLYDTGLLQRCIRIINRNLHKVRCCKSKAKSKTRRGKADLSVASYEAFI